MTSINAAIAQERRRTADLLESLTPSQLAVRSLCGDWTVREVAAHLLAAVEAPRGATLSAMMRSGFRLHRANALLAQSLGRLPVEEIADGLRRNADNDFKPPVVGYPGQLTDLLVHGQDIRRPLGLPHRLPLDSLRIALDFLTTGRPVGFTKKAWLAGLSFASSDLDWSFGSGPLVTAPAEALMMAMTGRRAVVGELEGPGVRLLASRLE
ncbi:maleylpyruvate isomerase family mycothiol-dependent enzyme [Paractinoplanes atraurantiacus]|uniref:TIGR03083 family protein n=1 Tax=Paractinoplanes atraurantiacus TaxID=1036182 RepID=A0A285HED7_9ACTN|nr:maleylpyruvate isomerase family mycothiol-dependent enzyme [Actinoplanes atraurantiacus]SNY34004.1 TIGR03083 family protein [Actinoplanes atraurantiacus]